MTVWNSLRSSFVSAYHHPRLWVAQFFGNLVLGSIFGLWLFIPDSYAWQVFLQFVVALIWLAALLVLHGGTLNYYSGAQEGEKITLGSAFAKALKHLPAFAIWAAIFYLVFYFTDKLDNYQYAFPGYLRSEFPAWLRRHISDDAMDNLYAHCVAILRWIILPGLLLPVGLLTAKLSFSGFGQLRTWLVALRSLPYWIVLTVAAFIGVYCTGVLLHWTLKIEQAAVGKEATWFAFRLLVAYLLALSSWLWICSMLARATFKPPAESQKAAA